MAPPRQREDLAPDCHGPFPPWLLLAQLLLHLPSDTPGLSPKMPAGQATEQTTATVSSRRAQHEPGEVGASPPGRHQRGAAGSNVRSYNSFPKFFRNVDELRMSSLGTAGQREAFPHPMSSHAESLIAFQSHLCAPSNLHLRCPRWCLGESRPSLWLPSRTGAALAMAHTANSAVGPHGWAWRDSYQ